MLICHISVLNILSKRKGLTGVEFVSVEPVHAGWASM
ncbi:hypothetical protein APH_0873 [Anaplasma phagocytophilum str. HZ]|uniref:Uncharacterized protein n=1 Tax=Anaplasma phagocytophilum (strain HZ) TaxID=212042 RepID=Q2GJK2_ANAPZ|nr:hypothetical protein APH_0873 [Anaplasma phagocytophilum str. HZ]